MSQWIYISNKHLSSFPWVKCFSNLHLNKVVNIESFWFILVKCIDRKYMWCTKWHYVSHANSSIFANNYVAKRYCIYTFWIRIVGNISTSFDLCESGNVTANIIPVSAMQYAMNGYTWFYHDIEKTIHSKCLHLYYYEPRSIFELRSIFILMSTKNM